MPLLKRVSVSHPEGIHPTAIIDPSAELDSSVVVGPYAIIEAGVQIDAGTHIGPHAIITGPTKIGKNNRIYGHAAVGGDPQDKKYDHEETFLEIGDDNTVREFATIHRGTIQDSGVTRIGNDNWIMEYVHIGHDCQVGSHIVMSNCTTLAGHVHVEDHVIMGGFSKIHQFCRVGAYAFTGMNISTSRDIPPYITVAGHIAEPKGINSTGLKRHGFSEEAIRAIKQAYRWIYRDDLRLEEAIEKIKAEVTTHPELQRFVDFLAASDRSIVR